MAEDVAVFDEFNAAEHSPVTNVTVDLFAGGGGDAAGVPVSAGRDSDVVADSEGADDITSIK